MACYNFTSVRNRIISTLTYCVGLHGGLCGVKAAVHDTDEYVCVGVDVGVV